MKPSQFAKKAGVTSRTAFRWWQQGQLKGYQMPSGTIVVAEEEKGAPQPGRVVISARDCSRKQAEDLERQVQRLLDYCEARGFQVARSVKEIASGWAIIVPSF